MTDEALVCAFYALLSSQAYLARNADALRLDYPRIPFPVSGSLLTKLATLGNELATVHLVETPGVDTPITTYFGPSKPEVGKVGWSNETVYLDVGGSRRKQPASPGTMGFCGVPEAVWNFHIGGYQVCEKWLKDRGGRTLSKDDITHYQKIVVAIAETIRLVKEIDEVIDMHGGWPGAFQTGKEGRQEPQLRKVAEERRAPYDPGDQ